MANLSHTVKSLHITRGIAASLVVIFHSKYVLWCGGKQVIEQVGNDTLPQKLLLGLDLMSSCGFQCVLLFFILSGFLIQYNYSTVKPSWKQFYIIRSIRIYLPYLASVVVSVILFIIAVKLNDRIACSSLREFNSRLLTAYNELDIQSFLKLLIFQKKTEFAGFNYAYWSLLHECIFYLIFPLYYFINTRPRLFLGCACFASGYFLQSQIIYMQAFFIAGTVIHDCYKTKITFFNAVTGNKSLIVICIISGFICLNLLSKVSYQIANIFTIIYSLFIFEFLLKTDFAPNRLLLKLSDFSYSIYLFHPCLLLLLYSVYSRLSDTLIITERYPYYLGAIAAIFLCYPFYLCFEKPSILFISKLKHKWNLSITKTLTT